MIRRKDALPMAKGLQSANRTGAKNSERFSKRIHSEAQDARCNFKSWPVELQRVFLQGLLEEYAYCCGINGERPDVAGVSFSLPRYAKTLAEGELHHEQGAHECAGWDCSQCAPSLKANELRDALKELGGVAQRCSFCGHSRSETRILVDAPNNAAMICDQCVRKSLDMVLEELCRGK